ncbi:hypothetical protein PU02_0043 [Bartonella ancashensis]|uniref:Uncharacterized protein n=1 Tax=Bartonella ancashensis TaxID=1318743 RepID=A0A0M4LF99_9HYPH|nr:hypothetical protein PU02_0043 [Bartonella ancashensis]
MGAVILSSSDTLTCASATFLLTSLYAFLPLCAAKKLSLVVPFPSYLKEASEK